MIDSAEANRTLRAVIREFENLGINSRDLIGTYIAFLLVLIRQAADDKDMSKLLTDFLNESEPEQEWNTLVSTLKNKFLKEVEKGVFPEVPKSPWDALKRIIEQLKALTNFAKKDLDEKDLAKLFQQHLRFELFKGRTRSQYPTPNHVAQLVVSLLDLQDGQRVIDPTCGTGGLLVAAHAAEQSIKVTGRDFNQTWAQLAWSNLYLNGLVSPDISISKEPSDLPPKGHFDRVIMNPPFGGKSEAIAFDVGTRSETVLTRYAFELLSDNGRAAVFVPKGVLFGGAGEQKLREQLKDHIEAIIELPPNAFQPYSTTSATLLLLHKQSANAQPTEGQPAPTPQVLIAKLTDDGYTAAAGRDLTQLPSPIPYVGS